MKFIKKNITVLKSITNVSTVILLSIILVSCFGSNPIASGSYNKGPYVINKATTIEKIKQAVAKAGGTVTSEGSSSVSFDLSNTKWTKEVSSKPEALDAYVVAKKFKQLGTNMQIMPQSVTSYWQVSLNDNKITVTLIKLVEKYTLDSSIEDTNEGYSLWNLEKKIEQEL